MKIADCPTLAIECDCMEVHDGQAILMCQFEDLECQCMDCLAINWRTFNTFREVREEFSDQFLDCNPEEPPKRILVELCAHCQKYHMTAWD